MSDSFNQPDGQYALLGLPVTASFAEVKVAYRQLARRYHPDLNPGNPVAEAHLKAINGAYAQLCDRYANPAPAKLDRSERNNPSPTQRHSSNAIYEIFAYAVSGNRFGHR